MKKIHYASILLVCFLLGIFYIKQNDNAGLINKPVEALTFDSLVVDEQSNSKKISTKKVHESFQETPEDKISSTFKPDNIETDFLQMKVKVSTKDDFEIYKNTFDDFYESLRNKDWVEFLNRLEELEKIDPKLLDIALAQALQFSAPIELVEEIIARGANVPEQAIVFLLKDWDEEKVELLENYGLRYDYVLPDYGNALTIAASMNSSPDVFDFLLSRDIPMDITAAGHDALSILIQNDFLKRDTNDVRLKNLLSHGAKLKDFHEKYLSYYKYSDKEFYQEFVEEYGLE